MSLEGQYSHGRNASAMWSASHWAAYTDIGMSRQRSLVTLNIPKDILTALTRKGYENVQDLYSTDPAALAKGPVLHSQCPYILSDIQISTSLWTKRKMSLTAVEASTFPQARFHWLNRHQSCWSVPSKSRLNAQASTPSSTVVWEEAIFLKYLVHLAVQKKNCWLRLRAYLWRQKVFYLLVIYRIQWSKTRFHNDRLDCANMMSPAILLRSLRCNLHEHDLDTELSPHKSKVGYLGMQSLPQFLLFLHQLPEILKSSKVNLSKKYFWWLTEPARSPRSWS